MRLPNSTPDLEHDKFTDTPSDQPAVIVENTDFMSMTRTEQASSNITFVGKSTHGSLTSSPVWQIKRITKSGINTITEYADSGKFSQVWDNRSSLFGAPEVPVFTNLSSVSFDGINDFINLGNNLSDERTVPWSFSFWVRPSAVATSNSVLYSKRTGNAGLFFRMLSVGRLEVQMLATATLYNRVITTNTVFSQYTWHHVVITYNGNGLNTGFTIYINGVPVLLTLSSNTLGANTIINTGSAQIGAMTSVNQYYSGHLDEISKFSVELTGPEVTELFNVGEPTDLVTFSNYVSLQNWWRMGEYGLDSFPTVVDQSGIVDGDCINMLVTNFTEVVP